ncbi:MAG: hypothetical protein H0T55_09020 [Rubrobacteraceae bacterium]|nr:hypothetical protein [Rubrobacteraceae bacterium]
MGRYEARLDRLEASTKGHGTCTGCGLSPDGPGRLVLVDDGSPGEGFPDDPDERCERCGRRLWCVIEVVYDSPAGTPRGHRGEGGG